MLEGGDPNAMLGVMKVSEANAASQQTLLLSPAPHSCTAREGDPNAMLGVMKVSEANAASQQTLLLSLAPHPSNDRGR